MHEGLAELVIGDSFAEKYWVTVASGERKCYFKRWVLVELDDAIATFQCVHSYLKVSYDRVTGKILNANKKSFKEGKTFKMFAWTGDFDRELTHGKAEARVKSNLSTLYSQVKGSPAVALATIDELNLINDTLKYINEFLRAIQERG